MVSRQKFHEYFAKSLPDLLKICATRTSGATSPAFPDLICKYNSDLGLVQMRLYGKENAMGLKKEKGSWLFIDSLVPCDGIDLEKKRYSLEQVNNSKYICDRDIMKVNDVLQVRCKLKGEPEMNEELACDLVEFVIREAMRVCR